jgi:peroxiredoxin
MEEMPSIQRLADFLRDRPFTVLAVNVGERRGRAKAAAQQMGIAFPVLLDEESAVFNRWGATVLPTTYVLDGEGVVRYLGRGPLEWDGVEPGEALDRLLKEGPGESATGRVDDSGDTQRARPPE